MRGKEKCQKKTKTNPEKKKNKQMGQSQNSKRVGCCKQPVWSQGSGRRNKEKKSRLPDRAGRGTTTD